MADMKTTRAFKSRVERLVRNTHADATIGFAWDFARTVKWADGSTGYSGLVAVTAPGYRTRTMVASFSHGELSVR